MNQLSERALLLLLAAVQFTHIVDFMILMPLGPQLMRELHIGPGQFSALVAAYTISSGVTGLLGAPFIDRFDRRKLLLFAYAGFTTGTLACALSQNAPALLAGRALSGAFGGLSISMVMAIIGDVVPAERRAEIDPSYVITHRLRLDDAPAAYKTFRDKEDGCIKVVLKP